MMKRLLVLFSVCALFHNASAEKKIVGGLVGTFYRIPGGATVEVGPGSTPGNEDSYFRRTSVKVPQDWIIYRDGSVTNVTMPTLNRTDWSYDISQSFVPGDVLSPPYVSKFYMPMRDVYDLSWEGTSMVEVNYAWSYSNHYYYAAATNLQSVPLPEPYYSVRPVRPSETNMFAVIATCEADMERKFFTSEGQTPAVVNQSTNMISSHRFYPKSVLEDARESIMRRFALPTDILNIISLTNGIINDYSHHYWSTSIFDTTNCVLPNVDWCSASAFGRALQNTTNICMNFQNLGWFADGISASPVSYLFDMCDPSYYETIGSPITFTNTVPSVCMPYLMTNVFKNAMKSRGFSKTWEDAYETWYDYNGSGLNTERKLMKPILGMNQALSIQDRTIHIPSFSLVCNGFEGFASSEATFSFSGRMEVSFSSASGKWETSNLHNYSFHQDYMDNNTLTYPRSMSVIFLETSKTDCDVAASGSGVTGVKYEFFGGEQGEDPLTGLPTVYPTSELLSLIQNYMDLNSTDPAGTNYIPWRAEAISGTEDGHPLWYVVTVSGYSSSPIETYVDGEYDVDVSGNVTFSSEYHAAYPTNMTYILGPTQPGCNAVSRKRTSSIGFASTMLYSTSELFDYHDFYPEGAVIKYKMRTYEYTDRNDIEIFIKRQFIEKRGDLQRLCPRPNPADFIGNLMTPMNLSGLDLSGNQATLSVSGNGYIKVTNWNTGNPEIKWCSTGASSTDAPSAFAYLNLPIVMPVKIEVEVSSGKDIRPKEPPFEGYTKFVPITQVDWNWKTMYYGNYENE